MMRMGYDKWNASGDPVIYDDEKAFLELQTIADYFLTHNRQIYAPVDDSIVSVVEDTPILIRRSRGYIPEPIHCESIKRYIDTRYGERS